jgi:DNA-binding MarR family transcriptional regulator
VSTGAAIFDVMRALRPERSEGGALVATHDLAPRNVLVLVAIADRMAAADGACLASFLTLAATTGLSRASVQRSVAELVGAGWLLRERRGRDQPDCLRLGKRLQPATSQGATSQPEPHEVSGSRAKTSQPETLSTPRSTPKKNTVPFDHAGARVLVPEVLPTTTTTTTTTAAMTTTEPNALREEGERLVIAIATKAGITSDEVMFEASRHNGRSKVSFANMTLGRLTNTVVYLRRWDRQLSGQENPTLTVESDRALARRAGADAEIGGGMRGDGSFVLPKARARQIAAEAGLRAGLRGPEHERLALAERSRP